MKCWYDGSLELRKGEVVKITNGHKEPYQGYELRVNVLEVVTTGRRYTSWFSIKAIPEPITGRVISSEVRGEMSNSVTTYFEIEEGNYENYVFVKPGEAKKGRAALKEILAHRTYEYVKICDPYLSVDTIKLLSNVGKSKSILILTQNITKIDAVKKQASRLPNNVIIRKGFNLHDRFILTTCEGWSIGHSLKDFGTRTSQLTKLESSLEAETDFDEKWNQSKTETVFEKC
jgi:hypothetical protein